MNTTTIPAEIAERAEILCDMFRDIKDDREFVAWVIMTDRQQRASAHEPGGLTNAQRELLRFIETYILDHGYSPSFSEIAEGIGLKSKGPVHDMVQRLVERGRVSFTPGRARSITITAGA